MLMLACSDVFRRVFAAWMSFCRCMVVYWSLRHLYCPLIVLQCTCCSGKFFVIRFFVFCMSFSLFVVYLISFVQCSYRLWVSISVVQLVHFVCHVYLFPVSLPLNPPMYNLPPYFLHNPILVQYPHPQPFPLVTPFALITTSPYPPASLHLCMFSSLSIRVNWSWAIGPYTHAFYAFSLILLYPFPVPLFGSLLHLSPPPLPFPSTILHCSLLYLFHPVSQVHPSLP